MTGRSKKMNDADYTRLADFRFALRRFLEFSASAAHGEGLTPQQHQALLVIRGSFGAKSSVGRLAERLCLKPNTAAELAKRLETGGWINRETNVQDRRTVDLSLTTTGETILESLSQAHRRELRQIGPEIAELFQSLAEENEP